MPLHKTEKARAELSSRHRMLGVRERAFLLMADGHKTRTQMLGLVPTAKAMIDKLIAQGYLQPTELPADRRPSAAPDAAMPAADYAAAAVASGPAAPARHGADAFEGKRSLATTRMFLFDICERMFARRAPLDAEALREALRRARDRDTMLAVARDIVAEVEAVAGAERADGLSARIAMLLPAE